MSSAAAVAMCERENFINDLTVFGGERGAGVTTGNGAVHSPIRSFDERLGWPKVPFVCGAAIGGGRQHVVVPTAAVDPRMLEPGRIEQRIDSGLVGPAVVMFVENADDALRFG